MMNSREFRGILFLPITQLLRINLSYADLQVAALERRLSENLTSINCLASLLVKEIGTEVFASCKCKEKANHNPIDSKAVIPFIPDQLHPSRCQILPQIGETIRESEAVISDDGVSASLRSN